MDKLKRMTLFTRVVELGSFAAAAQDQNVSPALVGRYVDEMERMLGLRLIRRTTRSMEVSHEGQQYYKGCKELLDQMAALESSIAAQQSVPLSGVIRVAAPDGLGKPFVLDAISSYQSQHPEVQFEVLLDNDMTDHVSAGVDVMLRLAVSLDDSSLIVAPIGHTALALWAAPSYLSQKGIPNNISDLHAHACLCFGSSRFGDNWLLAKDQNTYKIQLPWRLVSNQTHLLRDAVVQGLGIGLIPTIMMQLWLEQGLVQAVLPDLEMPELGIYALYPKKEYVPVRVQSFIVHLKDIYANGVGVPLR